MNDFPANPYHSHAWISGDPEIGAYRRSEPGMEGADVVHGQLEPCVVAYPGHLPPALPDGVADS